MNTSWDRIREMMSNADVRIDEHRVFAMPGYAFRAPVETVEGDEKEVQLSVEHVDELVRLIVIEGEIQVFGDRVACFEWTSGKLAVEDVLVMKPAERKGEVRHGNITSIQIARSCQETLPGNHGTFGSVFRTSRTGTTDADRLRRGTVPEKANSR